VPSLIPSAETAIATGAAPVWLLTMTLPNGTPLRLASHPIRITVRASGQGGPYAYEAGFSGVTDFQETMDVFGLGSAGSLTQASVDIVPTGQALGELQGDWGAVYSATVEIALIFDGQAWEDRAVLLDGGVVQGAEWGIEGQASTLSIEAGPADTSASIGDDARDLGTDWAGAMDTTGADITDLSGEKYQWVFGKAKGIKAYKIGDGAGSGNNRLVLAGHKFANLGAVTVYEDGVSIGTFTPAHDITPSGDDYVYVEDSGGARHFRVADGAFTYDADNGGIGLPDSTEPALNAEGVARAILHASELRVDWVKSLGGLRRLRGWGFALWLDQEASAIDVLTNEVLAYLPCVLMPGGSGYWIAYADPVRRQPVEALILHQNLVGRVGRMRMSDRENIANRFVMSFDYDTTNQVYRQTVAVDKDTNALCLLSEQRYRARVADPVECNSITDASTARQSLLTRADRLAMPRRILDYLAAPSLYWLRAGDVVTLTDPDYAISAHLGVVTVVERGQMPFQITVELVDRTPISRV
jgi:hypothetical protein